MHIFVSFVLLLLACHVGFSLDAEEDIDGFLKRRDRIVESISSGDNVQSEISHLKASPQLKMKFAVASGLIDTLTRKNLDEKTISIYLGYIGDLTGVEIEKKKWSVKLLTDLDRHLKEVYYRRRNGSIKVKLESLSDQELEQYVASGNVSLQEMNIIIENEKANKDLLKKIINSDSVNGYTLKKIYSNSEVDKDLRELASQKYRDGGVKEGRPSFDFMW